MQLRKLPSLTITCQTKLFDLLNRVPEISTPHKIPVDMIPISETDFFRYSEIWKARQQRNRKKVPTSSDWKLLETFVFPTIGRRSIQNLLEDPIPITLLFRNIEYQNGPDKARRIYQLLYKICKSIKTDYLLPVNICEDAYHPVQNPPVRFILSTRQRNLIYKISNTISELAPIGFCLSTGISSEELCNLRLADYHTTSGSLSIRNSLDSARYSRELPLSRTAMEIIHNYRKHCAVLDPQSQLFIRPGMRMQTVTTLRISMQKMRKLARVPDLSFQNIKRDFILNGIQHKLDPIQIKDYLGLKKSGLILDYFNLITQIPSERNNL